MATCCLQCLCKQQHRGGYKNNKTCQLNLKRTIGSADLPSVLTIFNTLYHEEIKPSSLHQRLVRIGIAPLLFVPPRQRIIHFRHLRVEVLKTVGLTTEDKQVLKRALKGPKQFMCCHFIHLRAFNFSKSYVHSIIPHCQPELHNTRYSCLFQNIKQSPKEKKACLDIFSTVTNRSFFSTIKSIQLRNCCQLKLALKRR